jgi:acyl-CoA thioester hydrolase
VSRVHVEEVRVRYAETDQMGVVYHANYLIWCDIGRTQYLKALGANYAELEQAGTMLAVSEASIRYHASARYDEVIRIETTLREIRSRALTSLDRSGRPVKLPDHTRSLLERQNA